MSKVIAEKSISTKSNTQEHSHKVIKTMRKHKGIDTSHKKRIDQILSLLELHYPGAECALLHQTPYQLLVATILSAQCTDVMVNKVTPALFKKAPTPQAMVKLTSAKLEKLIHSTGFYVNKAKNILAMSNQLLTRFNGEVPQTLDELITLPGVGRKTASVELGVAFHIAEGVVVDTHVTRLSQRLGFTKQTDAVKIEQDLMKIVPQTQWINISHQLILHGRQLCKARNPMCSDCFLSAICPSSEV